MNTEKNRGSGLSSLFRLAVILTGLQPMSLSVLATISSHRNLATSVFDLTLSFIGKPKRIQSIYPQSQEKQQQCSCGLGLVHIILADKLLKGQFPTHSFSHYKHFKTVACLRPRKSPALYTSTAQTPLAAHNSAYQMQRVLSSVSK